MQQSIQKRQLFRQYDYVFMQVGSVLKGGGGNIIVTHPFEEKKTICFLELEIIIKGPVGFLTSHSKEGGRGAQNLFFAPSLPPPTSPGLRDPEEANGILVKETRGIRRYLFLPSSFSPTLSSHPFPPREQGEGRRDFRNFVPI